MGDAQVALTPNEQWLLHTLVASESANPSDIGLLMQPSTLPAGSPDWPAVCAAIDALVALGLVSARPQHVFGSASPDHFLGVKMTGKGLLFMRSLT